MDADRKLKIALDESRLLILGVQVLFGSVFQASFQSMFDEFNTVERVLYVAALLLLILSLSLLIAPSLFHQIIFRGETRSGALTYATYLGSISLLPLTLGLGAFIFVVFNHLFGPPIGIIAGSILTTFSGASLYGFGAVVKRAPRSRKMSAASDTSLETKVEQMLTEARVIIPGGQALLGFQFVCMLTTSFKELPSSVQYLHAVGLCFVATAVVLLMTPASIHRIAFSGQDDPRFFKIGSALIVIASLPLALGIAADVVVVLYKVSENMTIACSSGAFALVAMLGAWFVFPFLVRAAKAPINSENR